MTSRMNWGWEKEEKCGTRFGKGVSPINGQKPTLDEQFRFQNPI
jgi:hypothetical protein